jgi:hypothetical protein
VVSHFAGTAGRFSRWCLPAACPVISRSRALHDVRIEPHRVVLSDAAERSRFPTPPETVERRPSVALALFGAPD